MNLKSISIFAGLIASTALAFSTAPARAASFSAQDAIDQGCVGQNSCTVNGFFNLSATKDGVANPQITKKIESGVTGLGVAKYANNLDYRDTVNGDPSGGEIDYGETLKVGFNTASVVDFLDLSYLYQPGVYADEVYEIAQVTSLGTVISGLLTVTGNTTATWSLADGTVQNLSASLVGSGGSYRIYNPFGSTSITGFSLTPKLNGPATSFRNSDFSLSGVKTVPEPGAVGALLGVGLLAGLTRRRSSVTLGK